MTSVLVGAVGQRANAVGQPTTGKQTSATGRTAGCSQGADGVTVLNPVDAETADLSRAAQAHGEGRAIVG